MQKFVSFLRGVNMTGHNSIKMAELASLYKDLGFSDVQTYIQSGNVIFKSADSETEVRDKIEKGISAGFGYDIAAMIRTVEELEALFSINPYLKEDDFNPAKMAVIFLHEPVTDIQSAKVSTVSYPPDKFQIGRREIFIYCPNGFGRTKLYTNFFENKMGVTGTARNWKTISTICELAGKIV
jgi:uncharacterized protein (DUF1697 family)